jgi:hypothetical protein
MKPDEREDQALRRSGAISLKRAILRNIQPNRNGSLPMSPFLLQRAQPIPLEKLRSTLQAALDLASSDLCLDLELEEEFKDLERSVVGWRLTLHGVLCGFRVLPFSAACIDKRLCYNPLLMLWIATLIFYLHFPNLSVLVWGRRVRRSIF